MTLYELLVYKYGKDKADELLRVTIESSKERELEEICQD